MMPIQLQAIPRQQTNFYADSQAYIVRVWFDGDDTMFADITCNGVLVAAGIPCIVGMMLLANEYLEGAGGNFIWTTVSGDNPIYTNFGTSDILLYASVSEMAQARATNAASLSAINLAQNQAA
jgi:hypothetical protein